MRWHRLTEEERCAFGVDYVDQLGAALLSAVSGFGGDMPFVIGTVFIDESGTGNEPRMMVAGLLASAMRWIGFTGQWRELLNRAELPYAHFYEMDRNEGPFEREKWWREKKGAFIGGQIKLVRQWCELGFTVSLDKALFRDVYKSDFPKGYSADSAYGVACKELVLMAQEHCAAYFTNADCLNFVIEAGHNNYPNAKQIFDDLKRCYGDRAASLGTMFDMEREKALPLQAIDQLVVMARRRELEAKTTGQLAEIPKGVPLGGIKEMLPEGETFPIFHREIDEQRLLFHREHKVEMTDILRRQKAARKIKS